MHATTATDTVTTTDPRAELEAERRRLRAEREATIRAPLALEEQLALLAEAQRAMDARIIGRFTHPDQGRPRDLSLSPADVGYLAVRAALDPGGILAGALHARAEAYPPGLPGEERAARVAELEARVRDLSLAIERENARLEADGKDVLRDGLVPIEIYLEVYGDDVRAFRRRLREKMAKLQTQSQVAHGQVARLSSIIAHEEQSRTPNLDEIRRAHERLGPARERATALASLLKNVIAVAGIVEA